MGKKIRMRLAASAFAFALTLGLATPEAALAACTHEKCDENQCCYTVWEGPDCSVLVDSWCEPA